MIQDILQQLQSRVNQLQHLGFLDDPNEALNYRIAELETKEAEILERLVQINKDIRITLDSNQDYQAADLKWKEYIETNKTRKHDTGFQKEWKEKQGEIQELVNNITCELKQKRETLFEELGEIHNRLATLRGV